MTYAELDALITVELMRRQQEHAAAHARRERFARRWWRHQTGCDVRTEQPGEVKPPG